MKQVHRLGPAQAEEVLSQGQQEQKPEERGGFRDAPEGDFHAELGGNAGQLQKEQDDRLGKQDSQEDAPRQGDGGAEQGLPEAHPGDVPLFQP